MTKLTEYRVARRHEGDRLYEEGETRVAREGDVKHLVPHVLDPIGPFEEQAADAPENEAEGPSPKDKADTGSRKRSTNGA